MDPLAHTLTGAALAGAGLRDATPRAAATLILAANAPDIDVLATIGGEYFMLAFRRGWTHGPLAVLLLPPIVAGLVLGYDRAERALRREGNRQRTRAGPVFGLAFLGVLTHPMLDWLNTYGIRLLMPFSERWFYGDALFIADPWLWLLLGGGAFLAFSRSRAAVVAWLVLAVSVTLLVSTAPIVPSAAASVWLAALAAIAASRGFGRPERPRRAAIVALGLAVVYIAGMVAASALAERAIARELERQDMRPAVVMFQPYPADPFNGGVVVGTAEGYRKGEFGWFSRPRLRLGADHLRPLRQAMDVSATASAGPRDAAAVREAAAAPQARDFLIWARFPYVVVTDAGDAIDVFIGDARYSEGEAGSLSGIRVRVMPPGRP